MCFQFIKGDKQILKNYLRISLFHITGKVLERLLYYRMFFIESNLTSDNQSGFKPGDSCITQILSINLLMIIFQSELYFKKYLKHSIWYGIKVLYTNSSQMQYRVTF